ncbi:flagellar hook-length control protein FliK [Parasporobacterium paucivorans]|uniref:Hook-length control protein FliK n=1 Tax=Parasporobacterium paucivorans DSM 15970 TaxID=1122934 RepID=A0A1M6I812_9FIRM|nr:flagellar hook-length control protein FliK [Parasporobacterium paucivorans]SHJ30599.1 hypothetical protein SAMN02745691_01708 [Parasporobacterium paucivorans DSM 15970]
MVNMTSAVPVTGTNVSVSKNPEDADILLPAGFKELLQALGTEGNARSGAAAVPLSIIEDSGEAEVQMPEQEEKPDIMPELAVGLMTQEMMTAIAAMKPETRVEKPEGTVNPGIAQIATEPVPVQKSIQKPLKKIGQVNIPNEESGGDRAPMPEIPGGKSMQMETVPAASSASAADTAPAIRVLDEALPRSEQVTAEETGGEMAAASVRSEPAREIAQAQPIKIEELKQPIPAKGSDPIIDTIVEKITGMEKAFEIQMYPENLGKVSIKVSYGQDGTNISIVCEDKKTMELLVQNAKDIGGIIEQNLGTPTTIFVEKGNDPNYLDQEGRHQGQRGRHPEPDSKKEQEKENTMDFLQQLRLGLITGSGYHG